MYYADTIAKDGWVHMTIKSDPSEPDAHQAYHVGFAEGAAAAERIAQTYINYVTSTGTFPSGKPDAGLVDFVRQSLAYAQQSVANGQSVYWARTGLLLAQLQGIVDGYTSVAKTQRGSAQWPALGLFELFLLNSYGDMDDLVPAFQRKHGAYAGYEQHDGVIVDQRFVNEALLRSHCSALVYPTADRSKLLVGHEMWATYSQLLMAAKTYTFSYAGAAAHTVSMSSYPGFISSDDDYYLLSSGLRVMETTNSIYNLTVYDGLRPTTLPYWLRVMHANYFAGDAEAWVATMEKENSGTYNNQWMLVDMHKFARMTNKTTGAPLPAGTLWIAEQMPGSVTAGDVTHVVNAKGYWASYNIPFFPSVFAAAGFPAMVAKYGDLYTHDHCPRANIFARNLRESPLRSVEDLGSLLRYNRFQTDPLSFDCPSYGLAARMDLAVNTTGSCAASAFGAINAKTTQSGWTQTMRIIAGPTTQHQVPFEWAPRWNATTHLGQPHRFDYDWIIEQPADL